MSDSSPPFQTHVRSLHGRYGPGEEHLLVEHVLAGCEQCLAQAAELEQAARPDEDGPAPRPDDYADVVAASVKASLAARETLDASRFGAAELWREIERFPAERQQIVVCNRRRYHHWGLCELLLAKSREFWFSAPRRALQLAELAVAVAETLEAGSHPTRALADLRSRAWATLGNGHRILCDFRAAEHAFRNAQDHLAAGTGSLLDEATLLEFQVAMRTTQRRFQEAIRLADQALRIYRQVGDHHLEGQVLIRKGILQGYLEDLAGAIRFLGAGLERVDPTRNARLAVQARHNLALFLVEAGKSAEALGHLPALRRAYAQLGDTFNLLRLSWLEGKIALAEGDFAAGEALLSNVVDRFAAEGIGFDAALAGLELAAAYAGQAKTAEIRQLASALVPALQAEDMHEEATAALMLFLKAAQAERASASLALQVRSFLESARNDPKLRFRPHDDGSTAG